MSSSVSQCKKKSLKNRVFLERVFVSRTDRVANLIHHEIANILIREINDSKIGFVSITHVRVSDDLEHAWIYYSQIGTPEQIVETSRHLQRAKKFIRFSLGKVLQTKTVPQLHFKYDDSLEKGSQILEKLDGLK
jgi:ribosome-binding factor A